MLVADEDKAADRLAQAFLDQCVRDGRITQEECDAVAVGRESSGCGEPRWKWCRINPKRLIEGVSLRDCDIYTNYPAWSMGEIAKFLGITVRTVRCSLIRIHRLLPSLKRDPTRQYGLPDLSTMKPLGLPGIPGPVIDNNDIIF